MSVASIAVAHLRWLTPDGRLLFDDLSVNFAAERTGVVGRNGVGKSTLLKLMAGELRPKGGRIFHEGVIGTLRQTVQVSAEETIADLMGATAGLALLRRAEAGTATADEIADADWTLEARAQEALAQVGLDMPPDTALTRLSVAPSLPGQISCCSTSRRTISTVTAGGRSANCFGAGVPGPSSSATTANCSKRWTRSSN